MISTATNTVVATVPTGGEPIGVAITPNGKFAYVTELIKNKVAVINTATHAVVATVRGGPRTRGSEDRPRRCLRVRRYGDRRLVGDQHRHEPRGREGAARGVRPGGLVAPTPPTTTTTSSPSSTSVPRSTTTSTTAGSSTTIAGPGATPTTGPPGQLPVTGSAVFPELVLGLALVTGGALLTRRRPRRTTEDLPR